MKPLENSDNPAAPVEDTYAEAFEGVLCRLVITADDEQMVRAAALGATSTPSVVIGRVEGGVERYLTKKETPDKRPGAIIQIWGAVNPEKAFPETVRNLELNFPTEFDRTYWLSRSPPFLTSCRRPKGQLDMMERVRQCGDGYEWVEQRTQKS